ncbi:MAG: hypothetical protein GY795_24435 [Desulfobacterales bacterium]|nr:hypothetical protein [Desulfobacterales bacterium]
MKIILALLIIIFLAFSGYHLTFRGYKLKLPLFARQFYLTGSEFLFLGLLLGPQFLNLIDEDTRKGLAPLSALVLGWIGMLYGYQFELPRLRKYPLEYMAAANIKGFITLCIVFMGVYFIQPFLFHAAGSAKIPFLLILAATAAGSTQTGLLLMAPEAMSGRRKTIRLLRYISSVDGLSALLVFGMAFAFRPSFSELSLIMEYLRGMIFGTVATVALVFLFVLFLNKRLPQNELILVVIGMIILTSGIASVLSISPLLTSFFVGFCIANVSRENERIYKILIIVEKPVYILLLVFLGTIWQTESVRMFLGAAAYCLLRMSGTFLAGFYITRLQGLRNHPPCIGFGLLEQGGITLAMLLDFGQSFPGHVTTQVISLILIAVVYNDLISPVFLNRLLQEKNNLKKAGDVISDS